MWPLNEKRAGNCLLLLSQLSESMVCHVRSKRRVAPMVGMGKVRHQCLESFRLSRRSDWAAPNADGRRKGVAHAGSKLLVLMMGTSCPRAWSLASVQRYCFSRLWAKHLHGQTGG
jgi:hypothetical protein